MSAKITKDMTFYQVLQMSPEVANVLRKYNLGCIGCMGAMNETLEQGVITSYSIHYTKLYEIRAFPTGEVTEILANLMSASSSPTI